MTVVVATFGDRSWIDLAQTRAVPSALAQCRRVIHCHGATLQEARNQGLDQVGTESVIHLDADDELEPGYLDAMLNASGDIRAPRLRSIPHDNPPGHEPAPWMPVAAGHPHECVDVCLTEGNWVAVGALAPTALLRDVGGWGPEPAWEDWALWLRCHRAGAIFTAVPGAVYRAHTRPGSRNQAIQGPAAIALHAAILADVYPEGVA